MQDIIIIHRSVKVKKQVSQNLADIISGEAVWTTCLRDIAFIRQENLTKYEPLLNNEDEIYSADLAYKFLLEVLCGMHSEIFGETEVLGQFKIFLQKQEELENPLMIAQKSYFQKLLHEVKTVRSEFLTNIGSQSYGSILRKMINKKDKVVIIGSGHLAGEILPWLSQLEIALYARNQKNAQNLKAQFPQIKINDLEFLKSSDQILVCAPIPNEELEKLISSTSASARVIDLRSECELLNPTRDYVSFSQLMALVQKEQEHLLGIEKSVLNKIEKLSQAFLSTVLIRPFGWDDICA